MDPITFREVARLINRTGSTRINDVPTKEVKGQWALYDGNVQTGAISIELKIIYILSGAAIENTREARSILKNIAVNERAQVVLAPSLEKENPGLVKSFRQIDKNSLFLNDFLSSFIRQQVENYLSKVRNLPCTNYVDPQIQVSGTFTRTTPNPVVSFLTDPEMLSPMFQGTLGVLLAEPGQGKTFMTRYLANQVAKKGVIPLYVHSEQWSRMQKDDISSIWKVLVHSFKHFESPIGWIEGAEEEFIKVALKAGLFRIIFDGFDEYVLWNKGDVDALETIKMLQQLTDETGARILITARTSFWNSEISENPSSDELRLQHIFEIKPFDLGKATAYFEQRFSNSSTKKEASSKLFQYLKNLTTDANMDFVGRGFFLFLIADLVARGFTLDSITLSGRTIVQWVMEALCERERTRQKIPFTSHEQIQVFEEFAELIVGGEPPTTDTLKLVFKLITNRSDAEIDGVFAGAGQLKDHPLIRLNLPNDRWEFTQDQIYYSLISQRLLRLSDPVTGNKIDLDKLLNRPLFNLKMQADVAVTTVAQIFEMHAPDRSIDKARELIGTILGSIKNNFIDSPPNYASSFATSIALIAVNKAYPQGSDRAERTRTLLSMFPNSRLDGLTFTGTLGRFDFSGIRFSNSTFNQVIWANCKFDAVTRFEKCKFHGGSVMSCQKFGLAQWENNCWFDEGARNLIEAECVREGTRRYTVENLRADVNYVLRRFIPKEGLGLRTVTERNLTTGTISTSIHCKDVIAAFKKYLIEEHAISGSDSAGCHIKEAAKEAVIYWATNGVYTGAIAAMFDELEDGLLKHPL